MHNSIENNIACMILLKIKMGGESAVIWKLKIIQKSDIVTKIRRFEWIGHIIRIKNIRTMKKIFMRNPYGIRTEIDKLRWLDCIEKSWKDLEVRMRKRNKVKTQWTITLPKL